MKNSIITETARRIQAATGADVRHLATVEKLVTEAYEAGVKDGTTVEQVAPLSDAEIATLRAQWRASKPSKAKK